MGFDEAVRQFRAALQARSPLWEVEAVPPDERPGVWTVECRHPASYGVSIEVDPTNDDHIAGLTEGWTGQAREFIVASAAPRLDHPERVRQLRGLIEAFQWPQVQVPGLVFLLCEHGFLNADEAAWLAGYAAINAPMQPVSLEGP